MQPLACVVSYSARQANNAKASFLYWTTSKMHGRQSHRGNIPVPAVATGDKLWEPLYTITVHVLYGAEMAIEIQCQGGEAAVGWEAPR